VGIYEKSKPPPEEGRKMRRKRGWEYEEGKG